MIIIIYGIWYQLDSWLGQQTISQVISLGTAILGGFLLYVVFCYLLKVEEVSVLSGMIKERFFTKRVSA